MQTSIAIEMALKMAKKTKSSLTSILKASSKQAIGRKFVDSRWTVAELIKVAEYTGSHVLFQLPDGETLELK